MALPPSPAQVRPTVRRAQILRKSPQQGFANPPPVRPVIQRQSTSGLETCPARPEADVLTRSAWTRQERPQPHRTASDVAVTSTETAKHLARIRPEDSPLRCRRSEQLRIADREPGAYIVHSQIPYQDIHGPTDGSDSRATEAANASASDRPKGPRHGAAARRGCKDSRLDRSGPEDRTSPASGNINRMPSASTKNRSRQAHVLSHCPE